MSAPLVVRAARPAGGRSHLVRVREKFGHLVPRNVAVEPYADPTPMADVRRPEVAIRRSDEGFLRARLGRTPQVREVVVVMAVRPQHRELLAHEETRCAVRGFLSGLGEREADRANAIGDVGRHSPGG